MFPGFVQLTNLQGTSDVRFIAVAPRSPLVMQNPRPGELAEAFRPCGFNLGGSGSIRWWQCSIARVGWSGSRPQPPT